MRFMEMIKAVNNAYTLQEVYQRYDDIIDVSPLEWQPLDIN